MMAQKYNSVSHMLVFELIPQVNPHVKIGSAKVSRKKTRKDYTLFAKVGQIPERNFEQPPCAELWQVAATQQTCTARLGDHLTKVERVAYSVPRAEQKWALLQPNRFEQGRELHVLFLRRQAVIRTLCQSA